jgi:hypothetical protein
MSLIPERPLVISPSLATTIGLEEAVLLNQLNDYYCFQTPAPWTQIDPQKLRDLVPFWNDIDIRRLLKSLGDKGIVFFSGPPFPDAPFLHFTFEQPQVQRSSPTQRIQQPAVQTEPAARTQSRQHSNGLQPMSANWQPSADCLAQIEQHGISQAFALEQLGDFVLYWQERGDAHRSWGHKFLIYVKKQSVHEKSTQQQQHRKERQMLSPFEQSFEVPKESAMTSDWRPDQDVLNILTNAGIDAQFIDDSIPEFILYWRERGAVMKTWGTQFVKHVRVQWARFTESIKHSTIPTRIPTSWQPTEDCLDVLKMANIDTDFSDNIVQEFVLYWRDSNQLHTSWNSKFVQYAKQQWAKRLNQPAGLTHEGQQNTSQRNHTATTSLEQRLSDTSWAD